MKNVECRINVTRNEFISEIQSKREPVLLRNLDIGPCVEKWNLEFLASNVNSSQVKVHVSTTSKMDFINKNFAYRSLHFDEFLRRVSKEKQAEYFFDEHEMYYLRSLGVDPRKDVADIKQQFPSLAEDINIPKFFEPEQFFSSVFRISSPTLQLWTHYDIMDNLLIQIQGQKRVVLFSPKDVDFLYLIGDKSAILDIDNPDMDKFPDFIKATRYECLLQPGDVLFIPALWFHNVTSLNVGVAVNVFWRHLDAVHYDKKDVYGNKDLTAAVQAMQLVHKATKCLDSLPSDYKEFYSRRLISHIQDSIKENKMIKEK